MSYTPMMGGSMGNSHRTGSYIPEYDSSSYKMPVQSYSQFPQGQQHYSNQGSSNIALFHIPNDATNSLYVDGVPNDTHEREVSRT